MFALRVVRVGSILLGLGACAAFRPDGPIVGGYEDEVEHREVLVENWTSKDLRISVFYNNEETPLGRVRPISRTTVQLPIAASGEVRLVARPLGSTEGAPLWDPGHVSERVHVFPGQRIKWMLRGSGGSAITFGSSSL